MKQLRDYECKLKLKDKKIQKKDEKIRELEEKLKSEKKKRKAAERELKDLAQAKAAKKPKFPDYSLSRQEKLRDLKEPFKSPGRTPKENKIHKVTREEDIYFFKPVCPRIYSYCHSPKRRPERGDTVSYLQKEMEQ